MKKAFSLIELVFVILIIGVLAGISLPYFSSSKTEAKILMLKADYTSIRSAIAYAENEMIIKNIKQKMQVLDEALANLENQKLFYCPSSKESSYENENNSCFISLLPSPIYSSKKGWMKLSDTRYRFFLSSTKYIDFEYDAKNLSFDCLDENLCKDLL